MSWKESVRRVVASRLSVTFVAVLICSLGAAIRLAVAAHDSGSPFIDENEVVEQAVAFMGGDLRHHFPKYGPLTMYVLAAIYHAVAAIRGLTGLEYASRVFFERAEHYFIARAFLAATLVVVAWLAFTSFRRQFGAVPALIVCFLLGLPWVDALYQGARIDTFQAALQGVALLTLAELVARPRRRAWVLAGACAGLAIAVKPLPGVLLLPCFPLASWFAAAQRGDGGTRAGLVRLGAALREPGLWLAALACIVCAFAANPTMWNLREFVASQQEAVTLHSTTPSSRTHRSVIETFAAMGWTFLAATALAALTGVVRRDPRALLATSFIVVYAAAFWGRDARAYFMVAPAIAACLLIGYAFAGAYARSAQRTRRWLACALPCAALLAAAPAWRLYQRTGSPRSRDAEQWFFANIPSGTPLVYVGPRALPLVGTDEKVQGRWGDHFEYGRHHYKFYRRAFHEGYTRYLASDQPRYPMVVHDRKPVPRSKRMPRSLSDRLLDKAQAAGQRYIVLSGYKERSVLQLGYRWFGRAILEKEVKGLAIFRVPEKEAGAATLPASAPPSGSGP
jgi:hypothetical protein